MTSTVQALRSTTKIAGRSMRLNSSQSRKTLFALLLLALLASSLAVVIRDPRSRLLAVNTLLLAAGTCAISLPWGTVLALLIFRTDMPGAKTAAMLIVSLLFMPVYLQCAGWQAAFGQQGWYSLAYSSLGVAPLLDGWRGAIWVHSVAAVPWVTLIVGVAVWFVEPDLEEAAMMDAAAWKVFLRVTMRRALAGVLVAGLWVVVTTSAEITVTDLFQMRTFAEEVYTGMYLGDPIGETIVLLLPGIGLLVCLTLVAWAILGRLVPGTVRSSVRPPWRFRLKKWRTLAWVLVLVTLIVLAGVPVGNLCYKAGVVVDQVGDQRERTWSLTKFLVVIGRSPWEYGHALLGSWGISFLAAAGSVCLAIPMAWWACRSGVHMAWILPTAATCFALPGPVIGEMLIWILNRRRWELLTWLYDDTILAPWTALVIRGFPLSMLILWYALRTIPTDTLQAAALDGAGPIGLLGYIGLPQRIAAVACAWLVSFAVGMADLAAVILVIPPGLDMLSVRIFGLLHAGVDDYVAGICLVNAAMCALIAGFIAWLGRRWVHRENFPRKTEMVTYNRSVDS